jgi:hypothetical protein
MSLIQAMTFADGATATWRKRNSYLLETPSANRGSFGQNGNPVNTRTHYLEEYKSISGLHGFRDGNYLNVPLWQQQEELPYINKPLNPADLLGDALANPNPIAGNNQLTGFLISRNRSPLNYADVGSSDTYEKLLARSMNPTDPLSMQYALMIQARQNGNTFDLPETVRIRHFKTGTKQSQSFSHLIPELRDNPAIHSQLRNEIQGAQRQLFQPNGTGNLNYIAPIQSHFPPQDLQNAFSAGIRSDDNTGGSAYSSSDNNDNVPYIDNMNTDYQPVLIEPQNHELERILASMSNIRGSYKQSATNAAFEHIERLHDNMFHYNPIESGDNSSEYYFPDREIVKKEVESALDSIKHLYYETDFGREFYQTNQNSPQLLGEMENFLFHLQDDRPKRELNPTKIGTLEGLLYPLYHHMKDYSKNTQNYINFSSEDYNRPSDENEDAYHVNIEMASFPNNLKYGYAALAHRADHPHAILPHYHREKVFNNLLDGLDDPHLLEEVSRRFAYHYLRNADKNEDFKLEKLHQQLAEFIQGKMKKNNLFKFLTKDVALRTFLFANFYRKTIRENKTVPSVLKQRLVNSIKNLDAKADEYYHIDPEPKYRKQNWFPSFFNSGPRNPPPYSDDESNGRGVHNPVSAVQATVTGISTEKPVVPLGDPAKNTPLVSSKDNTSSYPKNIFDNQRNAAGTQMINVFVPPTKTDGHLNNNNNNNTSNGKEKSMQKTLERPKTSDILDRLSDVVHIKKDPQENRITIPVKKPVMPILETIAETVTNPTKNNSTSLALIPITKEENNEVEYMGTVHRPDPMIVDLSRSGTKRGIENLGHHLVEQTDERRKKEFITSLDVSQSSFLMKNKESPNTYMLEKPIFGSKKPKPEPDASATRLIYVDGDSLVDPFNVKRKNVVARRIEAADQQENVVDAPSAQNLVVHTADVSRNTRSKTKLTSLEKEVIEDIKKEIDNFWRKGRYSSEEYYKKIAKSTEDLESPYMNALEQFFDDNLYTIEAEIGLALDYYDQNYGRAMTNEQIDNVLKRIQYLGYKYGLGTNFQPGTKKFAWNNKKANPDIRKRLSYDDVVDLFQNKKLGNQKSSRG